MAAATWLIALSVVDVLESVRRQAPCGGQKPRSAFGNLGAIGLAQSRSGGLKCVESYALRALWHLSVRGLAAK